MTDPLIHQRLSQAFKDKLPATQIDAILNECTDMECSLCAVILCPYQEPLHFHHDGCPACAVRYNTPAQEKNK